MEPHIFITGGTGMIGSELVSLVLKETDADISILVHEQGLNEGKEIFFKKFLLLPPDKKFLERIKLVAGDITKKDLAIDMDAHGGLCQNITHIIHCAASTRFDLPWEQAELINVEGTKNTVEFAEKCFAVTQFCFISTAYVSGKRTGHIREDELEHAAGFVNTYEQSKYEAEIYLKSVRHRLPIAVYRLTTVIGDSQTGRVSHFTAPHQAIRMMYLGLASMLPGSPEYSVDLISSDYTARAVFELYWNHFLPNTTFHITHGRGSFTLQEVIQQSFECIAKADPAWAEKNYPRPALVSEDAFDLFMNSAVAANNPILKNILTALGHFAHQLLYPKDFSRENIRASMAAYDAQLPDIRSYYGKVIEYCIRTKWGKIP